MKNVLGWLAVMLIVIVVLVVAAATFAAIHRESTDPEYAAKSVRQDWIRVNLNGVDCVVNKHSSDMISCDWARATPPAHRPVEAQP